MLAMVAMAAGICGISLAAGFAVRSRLDARGLPAAGATPGIRPAARGLHAAGAAPVIHLAVPGKWSHVARALLRPERAVVTLAVWLMLLDTALALAAPMPLMLVVDHGLSHHRYPAWLSALAGLSPLTLALAAAAAGLLLLAASATAGYLVTFLMGAVSERMAWRLRTTVLGHLLHAAPRRVAAFALGELTSRLSADTADVADAVAGCTETVIPDLAILAGMIAVTAVLDWRLTVIVLGVIPLYAVTARRRNRSVSGASRVARARSGELATLAADLLARIPAVHVFDRADVETIGYRRASARAAEASVAALDAGARFSPVIDTLPGLGLACALIAGTVEVASGRLTTGGLLVLLAYLSSLIGPVQSLARLSTRVARGTASKDRVAELLRLPPLGPAAGSPMPRPAARTRPSAARAGAGLAVELSNVTCAYRPGQPVLSGVSLHVCPGERLCVSGPSGAGKSTLLSLLVRLADPQHGVITIGGHDITGLPLGALRGLVTLVPQDPWLHTGSIADNIGYGRPGATRAEILAAAESAGVAAFAAGLPDGYDTQVGEHGRQLSGGQQRQVAIARALLRDTPVLLLDEPTTGLDPLTESRLVNDLSACARGKTVIFVTHQERLSELADRVVTLDQGRLSNDPGHLGARGTVCVPESGHARPPAPRSYTCV
jgi:ABC-type multidrug transport system fused ATPase/permease subunit